MVGPMTKTELHLNIGSKSIRTMTQSIYLPIHALTEFVHKPNASD